jgi:hypothetical protein
MLLPTWKSPSSTTSALQGTRLRRCHRSEGAHPSGGQLPQKSPPEAALDPRSIPLLRRAGILALQAKSIPRPRKAVRGRLSILLLRRAGVLGLQARSIPRLRKAVRGRLSIPLLRRAGVLGLQARSTPRLRKAVLRPPVNTRTQLRGPDRIR